MKTIKIHQRVAQALLTAVLIIASNSISYALKPGDTIPSQKLNYIDPVSGKKAARLTTMGLPNKTAIRVGQDSSGETRQWSPDSKSIVIWFDVKPYPKGYYLLYVETGVMKYLAPAGNSSIPYNNAEFNPRDPNEVIYQYSWKGSPSYVEIRGVKTVAPYTVRKIRRFDGISRAGTKLSMSHDGTYCHVMVYSPKGNAYSVVFNMLTKKDHPAFPYRGAGWNFKDNSLQDGCLWNPRRNKAILLQVPIGSTTAKKRVYFDFDKGTSIGHGCPTSHATWSADGSMTTSPYGIISESNQALSADKKTGRSANYFTPPHPFANPAEASLGDNGHIIGDCVDGLNWDAKNTKPRYLYYFTWKEIKTIPWKTMLTRSQNRIGLWWGDHSSNATHPHPQISPNGKYVVWVSNVKNRKGGSDSIPPGPKNTSNNGNYGDLFMLEIGKGSSTPPPAPTPTAPEAPSGLKASVASSTQINLTWADNSSDESGFKLERKKGSGGTYAQIAQLGANVKAYNDTGLASGATYYYRVRAYNSVGNSAFSNVVNATTSAAVVKLAAPSGLTVAAVSATQLHLSWNDHSSNESGFKIEQKKGSAGTFAQIAKVGANVKTYQNTGLATGATYYYRVRAFNSTGNSSYSNTANATLSKAATVPATPSGVTPSAQSSSEIKITWTDNSDNETEFRILRRVGTSGDFVYIKSVGANVTTAVDTGLKANTVYDYKVRAMNAEGGSGYSSAGSAKTPGATSVVSLTVTDDQTSEFWHGVASWEVSRTGDTSADLTVHYTVGGTATNGVDYRANTPTSLLTGSVVIPAGSASTLIKVWAYSDSVTEPDENIVLTLAPGEGYDIGASSSGTVLVKENIL